jgi:hypothetical protein
MRGEAFLQALTERILIPRLGELLDVGSFAGEREAVFGELANFLSAKGRGLGEANLFVRNTFTRSLSDRAFIWDKCCHTPMGNFLVFGMSPLRILPWRG